MRKEKIEPEPFGIIAEEMRKQIPLKYPSVAVEKICDHIHILLLFDGKMETENPSPTLGNVVGWYKENNPRQWVLDQKETK